MTTLLRSAPPKKPLWREYGEALLVALLLALVIRTFVVQAFKIPSESMLQTLLVGDHLLASKFSYGVKVPFTNYYVYKGSDPQRGEIIIFEYPNDPSVDYIKRIVGVPGDIIEVRNKQLYRNGEAVKESYIRFTQHRAGARQFRPGDGARRQVFRHGRQSRQFAGFALLGFCGPQRHPRQGLAHLLVVGRAWRHALGPYGQKGGIDFSRCSPGVRASGRPPLRRLKPCKEARWLSG